MKPQLRRIAALGSVGIVAIAGCNIVQGNRVVNDPGLEADQALSNLTDCWARKDAQCLSLFVTDRQLAMSGKTRTEFRGIIQSILAETPSVTKMTESPELVTGNAKSGAYGKEIMVESTVGKGSFYVNAEWTPTGWRQPRLIVGLLAGFGSLSRPVAQSNSRKAVWNAIDRFLAEKIPTLSDQGLSVIEYDDVQWVTDQKVTLDQFHQRVKHYQKD